MSILLSVIFSFRNEEDVLPATIKRVASVLENANIDYEMIFINDASTDRSLEILVEQREKNHKIKIIDMSRRFGVHPCVMAGFEHAIGDAVVYMDTDLQDPPELIPQMLEKYLNGYDVVHTTRTKRHGENAAKMWITKQAYRVINLFSEIDIPENTGDFKLISRRALNEILKLKENDPFMRGLSLWVGFKQTQIFYEREPRFAGETHFPLFGKGPIKEFIRGIASFSAAPLYFSFVVGVFSFIFSFILIIYAIISKIFGLSAYGTSSLIIVISFFSGLILISNGLVGLYIGRIYSDVKNRPRYIIQDKIGFND